MLNKFCIAVALMAVMSLCTGGCSGSSDNTQSTTTTTAATEQSKQTNQGNKFFARQIKIEDSDVDISTTTSKGRYCFEKLDEKEKLYYEKIRKGVSEYYSAFFWNNRECSKDTAEKLVKYVAYDYPEYFWYTENSGNVDMMTDKLIKRITFQYHSSTEDTKKLQPDIEKAVNAYADSAKDLKTDYQKALNAYEYIIKNTEYVADSGATLDTLGDVNSDKDIISLWNMSGVFINKKAGDRGYAQAFEYLMQQSGVECMYVQGADNGFYNVVKLDDDWYCVDVGEGDSTDAEIDYSYFAITSKQMATVHKTDENFAIELPECKATANNYFVKNPKTKEKNKFA